jgi:hypothetical protein
MNSRIRYIKDINGNFISQNYIKNVDGTQYRIGFVVGVKTAGFIKSVENDTTHITLEATSPHKIKIKLKKTLVKLGCEFASERRVMVKPRKNKKQS